MPDPGQIPSLLQGWVSRSVEEDSGGIFIKEELGKFNEQVMEKAPRCSVHCELSLGTAVTEKLLEKSKASLKT